MAKPPKTDTLSRAERKTKKRKAEDAIPDLPGDIETSNDAEDVSVEKAKSSKKRKVADVAEENGADEKSEKKRRKEEKRQKKLAETEIEIVDAPEAKNGDETKSEKKKKSKKSKAEEEVETQLEVEQNGDTEPVAEEEAPKKSKKERKAAKKAREAAEAAKNGPSKSTKAKASSGAEPTEPASSTAEANGEEDKPEKARKNNRNREKKRKAALEGTDTAKRDKADRFIVFIGNLPFSATKESVEKHFSKLKPKSVRALSKKEDPSKSKGCAFVEFAGYDTMKTCLKLMHHSTFDDGISPPRQINVELTAGGGGQSKDRKAKIEEKNVKLNDERVRRKLEEEKAKLGKKEKTVTIDQSDVHPSRRGLVPELS